MAGKLSSSKIGSYEMAKVKGGVELHYGSNAIGEYVWWYGGMVMMARCMVIILCIILK
jgi:hypothetical protein